MSYKNTNSDNFKKMYIDGYVSKESTLLEDQNIKKLLGGNIPKYSMLPACHLNFGNIGKIGNLDFDFGLPKTDQMNLNMFNKLSRLSDIIRGINARCITLIEELKCCSLAELYNSLVIPIFEWVLKDFINTLVSIAESILKSYQVMKVIFCTVRPVPGNPWLRGAGFDFLKYLYSFVEGFEAVYLWLVDGNPIDIILNPTEAFYKKISSCSPDKKRNLLLQNDELLKKDLAQIISSFNDTRGQNGTEKYLVDAQILLADINTLRTTAAIFNFGEDNSIYTSTLLEIKNKEEELDNIYFQIKKNTDSLKELKSYQDEVVAEKLINNFLAQRTLDKLMIDAYNPVCSCLLEMAGVHGYSPPNVITLNTWESFNKLAVGKVIWADKDRWITSIEKTKANASFDKDVSTIYISHYNFPEKYAISNTKLERNLITLRNAKGYSLDNNLTYVEDFGSSSIYFKSIDESGAEFITTFKIQQEHTNVNIDEIYTDSGFYSHSSNNINTVFELNEKRLDEKNLQTQTVSYLQLERRDYEKHLENAWNILRADALKTLTYGKYSTEIIDEWKAPEKTFFQGASDIFGEAIIGAKTIYNNIYNDSTEKITNIDNQIDDNIIVTPEQQLLIDQKNTAITQREEDISAANKVFYDVMDSESEIFTDSILTMANLYTNANMADIIQPAQKILDAQIMLDRLGTSFDIIKFIDLYNSNSNIIMPLSVYDKELVIEYQLKNLISNWSETTILIDQHNVMITRLEKLIEIDNFIVWFVDDELQICGCDILCVILQQILDIITSAINALIKTIMDRLLKMVVSEQATYIIKMITEKLKCYLMATEISKNIKKIGELSSALKNRNNQPLQEATDPVSCNILNDELSRLDKLYKNDEIYLNQDSTDNIMVDIDGNSILIDPIVHPMPDWGTNSIYDVYEPGNTLVNNGATIGDGTTGRNILSLYLNCEHGKFPNVEVQIEERNKFEILIAFIPGDSIIDAEIISIPQITKDPLSGVTDINGIPIVAEDIINPVLNLAEIMERVNKQVNAALDAPIYIENDCSPKPINNDKNNNITLCSRDNLTVSSIVIIEDDKIVNSDLLGKISTIKYYDSTVNEVFEYFPEHKNADDNGMVKIEANNPYWVYTAPDTETRISEPIITETKEIVPDDTVPDNTTISTSREILENFMKKIINTKVDTYFNQSTTGLEKIITTTIEETIIIPFRKSNLEFLVDFKNSVNHFKIRALLDIVAYDLDDVPITYNGSLYKGRYLDYVELGACPAGTGYQYIISFERLIYLSTKILKANYIITNPLAVAETIPREPVEPNKCLLPEETKQSLISTDGIIDNLNLAIDEAILSVENITSNLVQSEVISPVELVVAPILKSIPFLVLNKEFGILVQIVNRKMYLQFPSDSFHISEPTIIDYQLIPGEVYMFVFNTNGLTYKMSIITPDKEIYSTTGMNTSLISLQPSIIGGNENGTASMCGGTILDIIISKNGNSTIDYHNRSLMGYIPRLSQILFDFSLYQGSRVYNTIADIGNGYATKIPRSGSLSNEYGYGAATNLVKQQSDFYGNIISNQFYQMLDGYMDNFFCKDNLGNRDFSISLWVYNKGCHTNHHSIISDDIGKNYIYYDAQAGKIVIDFFGRRPINTDIILTEWTNIVLRYNKFLKTFYLVVHNIKGVRYNIEWKSTNKFSLMSLFAEYNYSTKKYYRNFIGYLSTISIFMSNIDERTYKDLYKNQKLLVQGMQKIEEVKK